MHIISYLIFSQLNKITAYARVNQHCHKVHSLGFYKSFAREPKDSQVEAGAGAGLGLGPAPLQVIM